MARKATRDELRKKFREALKNKRDQIIKKSLLHPELEVFKYGWVGIKPLNPNEKCRVYAIPGLPSMNYGITKDGRTTYRDGAHWYFADIATKLNHLSDEQLGDVISMLNQSSATWKWVTG